MPKPNDILPKLIYAESEVAELREELAEAEETAEELQEEFTEAIDREEQTAEIIEAVTGIEDDANEETTEIVEEVLDEEKEDLKSWLENLLVPLGLQAEATNNRLSSMEQQIAELKTMAPNSSTENPLSIPPVSETITNETETEISSSEQVESPAESAAENLEAEVEEAAEEVQEAPAKLAREIHKL